MVYRGTFIPFTVGVVGLVPRSYSPACIVRYRESSLHATLSITLNPCTSMEGGLWFQGDYDFFYTGVCVNVNMKLTSSISVTQVWKPPDVS